MVQIREPSTRPAKSVRSRGVSFRLLFFLILYFDLFDYVCFSRIFVCVFFFLRFCRSRQLATAQADHSRRAETLEAMVRDMSEKLSIRDEQVKRRTRNASLYNINIRGFLER